MTVLEEFAGSPTGAEGMLKRRREQVAAFGGSVRPLIRHIFAVVTKKTQIELEAPVWEQTYDIPERIDECRAAIGGEPHYLVLVAIVRKAEVLRDRLIEDTERMRKIHAAV